MYFKEDFYAELKQRNDIVSVVSSYITLKRKGRQYFACCPFHHEKTPSFAINEEGQYYHCFGCGESGSVVDFVMKMENVDRTKAIEILAERAGMKIPDNFGDEKKIEKQKKEKAEMLKALNLAKEFYKSALYEKSAKIAQEYLKKRKFKKSDLDNFEIGYARRNDVVDYLKKNGISFEVMKKAGIVGQQDNRYYDFISDRLVFPILNSFGECLGFSGRILVKSDEKAKYKNTAQTPVFDKGSCVYGVHLFKKFKQTANIDKIIIVEGQIDVIMMNSNGISPTVACMGTAFTEKHAKELKRFCDNIVLCFDGDAAGQKATIRAIDILTAAGLNVKVARLKGYDPDEYINTFGKEKMQELIDNAKYYVDYLIENTLEKYDLKKPEEKADAALECLNIIAKLNSASKEEIYIKYLSKTLNIAYETLLMDFNKLNRKNEVKKENTKVLKQTQDGNIKAIKYILLALYKNLDVVRGKAFLRNYIYNPIHQKIYDEIVKHNVSGKEFEFSEEEQTELNEILALDESLLTEKFINECTTKVAEDYLKTMQQILSEEYKETENLTRRQEISKEILEIIKKLKTKNFN